MSNFKCYLADWGTAGDYRGGTPMYAGPRTYEEMNKDLFSTVRLALELFLDRTGKMNTFSILEVSMSLNILLIFQRMAILDILSTGRLSKVIAPQKPFSSFPESCDESARAKTAQ